MKSSLLPLFLSTAWLSFCPPSGAASAPAGDFCAREAGLCAIVDSLDFPEIGIDAGQHIRYLTGSYLACLTWGGANPGSFPNGKRWTAINEEKSRQIFLYESILASFNDDLPKALISCKNAHRTTFSDKFCRSAFNAYKAYYTPLCGEAAAGFPDMNPVEIEYICRASVYPDQKTCASVKDVAIKERCFDTLNIILAAGKWDSPACRDSVSCRAFYRRSSGECVQIRDRITRIRKEELAKSEALPPYGSAAASETEGPDVGAKELSDSAVEKMRAGDFTSAKQLLLESLELDPLNREALMDLCVITGREGRKKEALDYCLAAAAPSYGAPEQKILAAEAMFLGSGLLYELGRSSESLKLLGECVEAAPPGWERIGEAKKALEKGALR